jgi:hypothetical protein
VYTFPDLSTSNNSHLAEWLSADCRRAIGFIARLKEVISSKTLKNVLLMNSTNSEKNA